MSLTGNARTAGVIGWPVAQSLSPRLHNFWLRELGIDGAYLPLPVRPCDFAVALKGLSAAGFAGVSVTIPHKQAAFAVANSWDDATIRAGAANLLLFEDGRVAARNTDVDGLVASLCEALGSDAIEGKRVVILGAGGAARAAILACDNLNADRVDVLNRTPANARTLVENLSPVVSTTLSAWGLDNWIDLAPLSHLLVNASSAGMAGTPSPPVALELLSASAAVCDLVYNPLETHLLARARRLGLCTIDGLGMLMNQAVPAFAAFYGIRPSITPALRTGLERALAA